MLVLLVMLEMGIHLLCKSLLETTGIISAGTTFSTI